MAFLKLGGQEVALPNMVGMQAGSPEMVENKGTPTVQYVTMYQMKQLGVPFGGSEAGVQSVHLSDIQNVETIIHLHYLRKTIGGDVSTSIEYTPSVKYAETTAVQTGYARSGAPVVSGGIEGPIRDVLEFQERGEREAAR